MEVLIIVLLIFLNGLFAMSEIAVISSRRSRLARLADRGDARSRAALALHDNPNTFLSTIQIGITLIGVLAGAFGEAAVADDIEHWLAGVPLLAPYRDTLALVLVVIGITYFSLVVGELVPKRLALLRPESIARAVALPMRLLARAVHPAVRLLSVSVDAVLALLRARPSREPSVTEKEVHGLIDEATRAGVFLKSERNLLRNVARLSDYTLSMLMCPRDDIVWLDLNEPEADIRRKIAARPHTRYPVARGRLDDVAGIVHAKTLLAHLSGGRPLELAGLLRPPIRLQLGDSPLRALDLFRASPTHAALVVSAAGEVRGILTLHDILDAIVGGMPTERESAEAPVVRRDEGGWLLDGMLPTAELKDLLKVESLVEEEDGGYRTLGGFVLSHLGRVPAIGENFIWSGFRFEIVDMDGQRIDRVLVTPMPKS